MDGPYLPTLRPQKLERHSRGWWGGAVKDDGVAILLSGRKSGEIWGNCGPRRFSGKSGGLTSMSGPKILTWSYSTTQSVFFFFFFTPNDKACEIHCTDCRMVYRFKRPYIKWLTHLKLVLTPTAVRDAVEVLNFLFDFPISTCIILYYTYLQWEVLVVPLFLRIHLNLTHGGEQENPASHDMRAFGTTTLGQRVICIGSVYIHWCKNFRTCHLLLLTVQNTPSCVPEELWLLVEPLDDHFFWIFQNRYSLN